MVSHRVKGMTCAGCAKAIQKTTKQVTGSPAVEVGPERSQVRGTSDADQQIVSFAIQQAGYRVEVVC